MIRLSFMEVMRYDKDYGTSFLDELEAVSRKYAISGQEIGVWTQFKTDWIRSGIDYALKQTLRYEGFGYSSARVFRDLGIPIWKILVAMGLETSRKT